MAKANAYFQQRASIDPESDCLVWLGMMRDTHDSGKLKPEMRLGNRGNVSASRYAWELVFGKLDRNDKIRNECGNRECVNPAHYVNKNLVCPKGHARTPDNILVATQRWKLADGQIASGTRFSCRTCRNDSQRKK
jgi:hypothetical protein